MIESKIADYPIILPEHRHAFHSERPNWHKAWLDSIHESLKPDDVVIDVGAEQGDLSALVASWVPDGGVVLVEPQPLFWVTIRETFEANGLKPKLTAPIMLAETHLNKAGWINEQWPPFVVSAYDSGFYHLNEHGGSVAQLTLDMLCAYVRPFPSALIVDVEGAEFHVLKGGENLLLGYSGLTSPPLVWCAIHPEIMYDRYGHDPNELLAFMYRLGYRWDFLGFQGELHFKFSPR